MSISVPYLSCLLGLWCGLTPPAPKEEPPALWSLQPVVRPPVPAGAMRAANPIDAFLAASHQAQGLQPAGAADRRSLLRRVYLDLIGLPLEPAMTAANQKVDPAKPLPVALSAAPARSGAALGFDFHGGREARPVGRRRLI